MLHYIAIICSSFFPSSFLQFYHFVFSVGHCSAMWMAQPIGQIPQYLFPSLHSYYIFFFFSFFIFVILSFFLFCSATWKAQPIGQIPQSPELPPHPENGKLNIYLRSENFSKYFFAQIFKTLLVALSVCLIHFFLSRTAHLVKINDKDNLLGSNGLSV